MAFICRAKENKTAELSQRRPRDAPNMGALKKIPGF